MTTFSIMTLSIKSLFVPISIDDTQLTITTHCYDAEYHILFIVMLNVIMLSVVCAVG